ncbi:hypothetical protein EZV62_006465 [Acer yangbiense]|uniref:IBB domain-containing protein n=1 Tax=Acer yangbiense TaxID=1000413 RepID=A0A5C7I797_9ROSI|nr:hypothetical protein EZV62_006465 [Acer yangbiense]
MVKLDGEEVPQNMAEVHQKYDFIDPHDPMWDCSPFIAKSDSPKHQYFVEYANQLKDTEGFHVDLIPIQSVCCTWILPQNVNSPMIIKAAKTAILKFEELNRLKGANLTLDQILSCNYDCFYEAKIYLHMARDYELVMFRPAKFWPRKNKYTNEEGGAEPEGSQIIGKKRKSIKDKNTNEECGAEPEGSQIIGKKGKSNQTLSLMEVRQNCYKVAVDADERRQRSVEIRKRKISKSLKKKQREGLQQQQQLSASAQVSSIKKLEQLPDMVAGIMSYNRDEQLVATTQLRRLLSTECSPPIEEVIQSGVVPCINIRVLLVREAIPNLVKLLVSPRDDVCEQAMWALVNVASESPRCRDFVLGCGALRRLQEQLKKHDKLPMLRNATWTLSIFCRGKPQPPFYLVKPAFPALAQLILLNDEEVLTDVCWALSYLSDGTNDKIQAVIDVGVCLRLVEFLTHPSPFPSVLIPALRTVGNIVTGDDLQTQGNQVEESADLWCIISHQALPCLLNLLTNNYKKSIKKEACWTISNITAGNKEQIHAVIEANIIGPLIHLLQNAEFDIKTEAAWAISNATSGGTHEQIKYLVSQGCIKPLCDLLVCLDPRIVTVCLEGLENILKVGEADKSQGNTGGVNVYAQMIDDAEGLEKIENLQSHDNIEIYEKAVKIPETYWKDTNEGGVEG